MPYAVVGIEELDHFRQVFTKEGFAAGDPEFVERRRRFAPARNLVEGEVLTLIELVPVEAGAA